MAVASERGHWKERPTESSACCRRSFSRGLAVLGGAANTDMLASSQVNGGSRQAQSLFWFQVVDGAHLVGQVRPVVNAWQDKGRARGVGPHVWVVV